MFCTKCGAEVSEGQKFCQKCGNQMQQVASNDTNKVTTGSNVTGGITPKLVIDKKIIIIAVAALVILVLLIKLIGGGKNSDKKKTKVSDEVVTEETAQSSGSNVEDMLASFDGEYETGISRDGTLHSLSIWGANEDGYKRYGYVVGEANGFGDMKQVRKVHVSKRGIDYTDVGTNESHYYLADELDYEKTEYGDDSFIVKATPNLRFVFTTSECGGYPVQYLIPQVYVGSGVDGYTGKVQTGSTDDTDGKNGFMFVVKNAEPGQDGWASFDTQAYGKWMD